MPRGFEYLPPDCIEAPERRGRSASAWRHVTLPRAALFVSTLAAVWALPVGFVTGWHATGIAPKIQPRTDWAKEGLLPSVGLDDGLEWRR